MDRLLRTLLNIIIRRGSLRVTTAAGTTFVVGDGSGHDIAILAVRCHPEDADHPR